MELELTVPDDIDFADCDHGQFRSWGPVNIARIHQGPGQHDLLWVVDMNWKRFVIDGAYLPGTSAAVISEIEAVMESIRLIIAGDGSNWR